MKRISCEDQRKKKTAFSLYILANCLCCLIYYDYVFSQFTTYIVGQKSSLRFGCLVCEGWGGGVFRLPDSHSVAPLDHVHELSSGP
jgi:hypothetical protein